MFDLRKLDLAEIPGERVRIRWIFDQADKDNDTAEINQSPGENLLSLYQRS